jgi:hypothetical protein
MTARFDVFLCHNSKDKPEVRKIKDKLQAEGVQCFLDESYLIGGEQWKSEISRAIRNSRSVAIFVGRNSLGRYQKKEIKSLEGRTTFDNLKVIPVLLDTANQKSIEIFHSHDVDWIWDNHYVDLDRDPIENLIRAIMGENFQQLQTPVKSYPIHSRSKRSTEVAEMIAIFLSVVFIVIFFIGVAVALWVVLVG